LNARTLHRAQTERARAEHQHVASRLDGDAIHRQTKSGCRDAREKRQLHRRDRGGHRYGLLLPSNHQFRETAERACDRRPARHVRHRRVRAPGARRAEVAASVETVPALSAVRGHRHDHTIAHLNAPNRRSDRFDDPDAAVSGDRRTRRCVSGCARWRDSGRREEIHDRVAGLRGFSADDDLVRLNGAQCHRLDAVEII
jgi:hypothetical protein